VIKEAIQKVCSGEDLTIDEATETMGEILDNKVTEAQIGAFLVSLHVKGESVSEIAGGARAMRSRAIRVTPSRIPLVDTCGTGGDHSGTFNISTTAALVAAGAGVAIAKHGNRSVTSRSGSADLLEILGVPIIQEPEKIADAINGNGFGFLFAPVFHPSLKPIMPVRRQLGVRTLFNILGPLANPTGLTSQVLGVSSTELLEKMPQVMAELGCKKGFVVHGPDGIDELTTTGVNHVVEISNHTGDGKPEIRSFALDPSEYKFLLAEKEEIMGGTPEENAEITLSILKGDQGPARDTTLLNASLAIVVGGKADTIEEGIEKARKSIDSGLALGVLQSQIQYTDPKAW
jgi:anthranilate phosphoribosyltransferase